MGKELTIATMNLQNLHVIGGKLYGKKRMQEAEFIGKVEWISKMLIEIKTDIIGFQECWHRDALLKVFEKADFLKEHEVITYPQNDTVSVALAIRKSIKIIDVKWYEFLPKDLILKKSKKAYANEPEYEVSVNIEKFSRPVLNAKVELNGGNVGQILVAHFKSQLGMRFDTEEYYAKVKDHSTAIGSALSTIKRTAEATGLRIILNDIMRDTDVPVIVMGDLNDDQHSVLISILTEDPSYRLFKKSSSGKKSDRGLYSVATLQELRSLRDVYYTYMHDGFRSSLDHILVSEQFYDYSNKSKWSFNNSRTYNDHVENKKGEGYASDHGVVVATFDFNG